MQARKEHGEEPENASLATAPGVTAQGDSGWHPLLIYCTLLLRAGAAKLIAPLFLPMKIKPHRLPWKCHIPRAGEAVLELEERRFPRAAERGAGVCMESKSVRGIQHLSHVQTAAPSSRGGETVSGHLGISSQTWESGLGWKG